MRIFRFSKDNPFKVFLNKVREGLDERGGSYNVINDFLDFMPFTFEKQKEIFSYAAENFASIEIRKFSEVQKEKFFQVRRFEYILRVRFLSEETFDRENYPPLKGRIELLSRFMTKFREVKLSKFSEDLSAEDKALIILLGNNSVKGYSKEIIEMFKEEILKLFKFDSFSEFYNIDLSEVYFRIEDSEKVCIGFEDFSFDLKFLLSHDVNHLTILSQNSPNFIFLASINLCLLFEQKLFKYIERILNHKNLSEINLETIIENTISFTLKRASLEKSNVEIINKIQHYNKDIFSKKYNNYLLFFLLFNYLKNSVLSIEDSRKRDDNKIILDMKTTSIENRFINFLFIGQNYSFLDIDSLLRNMFFNTDKMRREDVNRIEGLSEWIDDDFGNCQIRICDIDEALFISELRGDSRVVKGSGVGTGTYHLLKKLGVYVKSFRGGYLSKNGEYYQGFMIMFSEPNNKGEFLTFEDFQKTRAYQNLIKNKVA